MKDASGGWPRPVTVALTVLGFALLWALPRLWLFQAPAMMHDDYTMARFDNVYDVFFVLEYRFLGGVFPTLWKWLFPGFYSSSVPIYVNALLIGGIATMLFQLLRALGCGRALAVAVTALFTTHPLINDISAWNTMGFALVAANLAMGAFVFAWRGTVAGVGWGAACTLASLGTYQLMLPLPMCMAVLAFAHLAAVEGRWEWRRLWAVAIAMVVGMAAYLVYVFVISPLVFGPLDVAGLTSPGEILADWRALFSQTLNLYLNLFYTPFAHHIGIRSGLGLWYYVPAAFALAGALVVALGVWRGRLGWLPGPLLLGTWVLLPFLAIAPLWFIPLYTEWRISFVPLIAQVLALGSLGLTLERCLGSGDASVSSGEARALGGLGPKGLAVLTPYVFVCAVLVPVTFADSRMRIEDYRHDLAVIESIRAFRTSLGDAGDDHRVLYVERDRRPLRLGGEERAMMKANYVVNTYSTLAYGRLWALSMLRFYGCDAVEDEALVAQLRPSRPGEVDVLRRRFTELPWVEHYVDERLSVVVGAPQWYPWVVAP